MTYLADDGFCGLQARQLSLTWDVDDSYVTDEVLHNLISSHDGALTALQWYLSITLRVCHVQWIHFAEMLRMLCYGGMVLERVVSSTADASFYNLSMPH